MPREAMGRSLATTLVLDLQVVLPTRRWDQVQVLLIMAVQPVQ
jgi:hypothetical protein